MVDSIKITALQDIGANIAYTTLVPLVNMAGTPTTQKANLQNLGNLILNGAGGSYFARAAQANLALSVANAAQPNITSVGTLTSLAVTGNIRAGNANLGNIATANFYYGDGGFLTNVAANGSYSNSNVANYLPTFTGNVGAGNVNATGTVYTSGISSTGLASLTILNVSTTANLGAVGNVRITGGTSGQKLTTDGAGNLSWTNDANSNYGNSNVAAYLPTYTGNVGAGNIRSAGNLGVTANTLTWNFTNEGVLQWPGGIGQIDTNNSTFEIHSTNGLMISTNEANSSQSFLFGTDGTVSCPANANFEGTRLNVGPGASNVSLTNPTLVITDTGAEFIQAAILNEGSNGSSDYAAYGADSDETQGFADLGFAGHTFNDPNYTITEPGDGYVFVQGYANGIGGQLVLATGENGNVPDIIFATGGFLANAEFARIDHANDVFHLTRANSGIQFADGSIQTTASGGGANTGNVTFDDVTVQGDDTALNLSAGPDFTANLAYLQVRAGDVASHIHFDTGNSEAYDLIVGNDQKFVQVSSTGNIIMSSYDSANALTYTMTLDNTGNLNLSDGNSVIRSLANSSLDPINPNVSTMIFTPDSGYSSQSLVLDPTLPGHIHLRAPGANIDEPYANIFLGGEESSFEVGYHNGNAPNVFIHSGGNTWTFDTTGSTIYPTLTVTRGDRTGTLTGQTLLFGDSMQEAIISTPNGTNDINASQRFVINPGAGATGTTGEGGDIYLYAGRGGDAGGSGGDIKVRGGLAPADGTGGYLDIQGGDTLGNGTGGYIDIRGGESGNAIGGAVNLYGGYGPTIGGNVTITGGQSGTGAGGNVIITGGTGGDGLSTYGSVSIASGASTWAFDNTGNLTLPGNTVAIKFANGTAAFGNVVSVNLDGNISNVLLGNGAFAAIPSSSIIANGNSNVSIASSNGNVVINAVGNTTMTVTGTGANVTGTLTSTGKIGYASGSTVTQTTNRGNGVTINALAGTIITTSAIMVANQIDTFSVANDKVDPNNDIVLVQIVSPNFGVYNCIAQPSATISVSLTGFYVNIVNISGFTTTSDAITIRFMVIKAPNA